MEVVEKMAQIDKQRDKAVQTDGSPVALFNFFVTVIIFIQDEKSI